MMSTTWLIIAKEIYDAIHNAIVEGYYAADDLENINYYEIRNWVGLAEKGPKDLDYTDDDKKVDDYISNICHAMKSYIEIFE